MRRGGGAGLARHCAGCALSLTDWLDGYLAQKLDQETIMTALLHDTVEDTLATIDDIEANFGPDVARLVDGVTKLSKIEQMPENERAAENLRKFLLAMSEDIRVLLVKLGDRLHNMRTLHFIKKPEKRQRIARETMDIYAPLAERIGMYEYMREMQMLAFEQIEPEAFKTITQRLDQIRNEDGGQVDAIALAPARAHRQGQAWPSGPSSAWRSCGRCCSDRPKRRITALSLSFFPSNMDRKV